jgi:hypothetical protein
MILAPYMNILAFLRYEANGSLLINIFVVYGKYRSLPITEEKQQKGYMGLHTYVSKQQ